MEILNKDFLEYISSNIDRKVDKTLKEIIRMHVVNARYVSKTHACVIADIDTKTLNKWIAKGLPLYKIDGCFRISIDELDEFIKKHEIGKIGR